MLYASFMCFCARCYFRYFHVMFSMCDDNNSCKCWHKKCNQFDSKFPQVKTNNSYYFTRNTTIHYFKTFHLKYHSMDTMFEHFGIAAIRGWWLMMHIGLLFPFITIFTFSYKVQVGKTIDLTNDLNTKCRQKWKQTLTL